MRPIGKGLMPASEDARTKCRFDEGRLVLRERIELCSVVFNQLKYNGFFGRILDVVYQ